MRHRLPLPHLVLAMLAACLMTPATTAQVSIGAFDTAYAEDFEDYGGAGFAPTPGSDQLDADAFIAGGFSDGAMQFGDTQATDGTDFTRGANVLSGGVLTGGVYAFDTDNNGSLLTTDVGWGVQPAGEDFTPGYFVVRYVNDTGSPIGSVDLAYEIKVLNDGGRSSSFDLSYAVSAADTLGVEADYLDGGAFSEVPASGYVSPEAASVVPTWATATRSVSLNVPVPPGSFLFLRFRGDDVGGSGGRDEIALDDLSVTARATASGLVPGDVAVTEVMADPTTPTDTDGEYFEVYNRTASAIDLDGWILSDDDGDRHVIANAAPLLVPAGGFLVLCANSDSAVNGGLATCAYQYADLTFAGDGSADELVLNDGTIDVFRMSYSDGAPSGQGVAMELRAVSLVPPSGVVAYTRVNFGGLTRTYVDASATGALPVTGDAGSPGAAGNTATAAAAMTLGNVRGEEDAGDVGWYLLSAPSTAFTLADLAAQNGVQGVDGYFPGAESNLYTSYTPGASAGFVEPTGGGAYAFTPGRGFIWYHFDNGVMGSAPLPYTLAASGAEPTGPVGLTVPAGAFSMAGNPYRGALPLDAVTADGGSGTLSDNVCVWDPFAATYRLLSRSAGDLVAPWQGFFLEEAGGVGSVDVRIADAATTGGVFYGRQADASLERRLGFALRGRNDDLGLETYDEAALLRFHPLADAGPDAFDGTKLSPLTGVYGTLSFVGEAGAVLRAVESRAYEPGDFAVELDVQASLDGTFELTWPVQEDLPATWRLELEDRETGAKVDLRTASSYTFSAGPPGSRRVTPETVAAARRALPATLRATPSWRQAEARTRGPRFVLRVTTGAVANEGEALPSGYAMSAVYPNPSQADARFHLTLDAPQTVRAEVFDALGRRVAVLADGAQPAGGRVYRLDGRGLASGVYVIRVAGERFVETRRVTLVR